MCKAARRVGEIVGIGKVVVFADFTTHSKHLHARGAHTKTTVERLHFIFCCTALDDCTVTVPARLPRLSTRSAQLFLFFFFCFCVVFGWWCIYVWHCLRVQILKFFAKMYYNIISRVPRMVCRNARPKNVLYVNGYMQVHTANSASCVWLYHNIWLMLYGWKNYKILIHKKTCCRSGPGIEAKHFLRPPRPISIKRSDCIVEVKSRCKGSDEGETQSW